MSVRVPAFLLVASGGNRNVRIRRTVGQDGHANTPQLLSQPLVRGMGLKAQHSPHSCSEIGSGQDLSQF